MSGATMDDIQGYALRGQVPSDVEMDALERNIESMEYCGNDILLLIREVRRLRTEVHRLRTTGRVIFDLIGKFSREFEAAE